MLLIKFKKKHCLAPCRQKLLNTEYDPVICHIVSLISQAKRITEWPEGRVIRQI